MGFEDWGIWAWTFFVSEWVIRIVMLVVIPVRRPPAAAKTWLLLILFEPWAGLLLFWLIGSNRLPARRQERVRRHLDALRPIRDRLEKNPTCAYPELKPELKEAVVLAMNLGQLPILGGNTAELLTDYDGTVDRLVADIDAARHHVHLLYYIFAADETGDRVIEAIRRAARRGVRCRVLADSLGSRWWFNTLYRRMTEAGADVEEALPVGWLRWRAARLDLRNHRKIAVIDGRVGYTGSQNLINAKFKDGLTYDELVVRITGPAVLELQYVFVGDWSLETDDNLDSPECFPEPERTGEVPVQALPSGPGYPTENNQRLMVALIHGADERVVITTPYFIPDEPLLQAMQTAVLRGVEVHLIVSQQADSWLVTLAQRSYYGQMLDDGIKIHAYKKHFLHAKHLSIDDELAIIGTSNMDIRSFALNAEITLLFYDDDVARRLHRAEEGYLRFCDELTAERWHRRPFALKVAQRIARLMSPLL